jgi:hypothetical protein
MPRTLEVVEQKAAQMGAAARKVLLWRRHHRSVPTACSSIRVRIDSQKVCPFDVHLEIVNVEHISMTGSSGV